MLYVIATVPDGQLMNIIHQVNGTGIGKCEDPLESKGRVRGTADPKRKLGIYSSVSWERLKKVMAGFQVTLEKCNHPV